MKNLLLNLGLKLIGRDIFSEYRAFRSLEFNSLDTNKEIQKERLKKTILHSWSYVPYYKNILEQAGVVAGGQVHLENFNQIPILSKEIIRNNFNNLKSQDQDFIKRKPYLNTSGGSTGEPVKFIQDKKKWTEDMAAAWLFCSFVSEYPCKLVKLWGSERDIIQGGYSIKASAQNYLYQRLLFNSFKMSKADMENYVQKINSFKPIIIEAYVQSLYELSKFIKDNRLKVYSPKGVIVSAGTLYPAMKDLIKEVFRCDVLNRYGSREVGAIAISCKKNEGLHLNIFGNYLEILNNKLEPCKAGELGKVYITTLNNFSMPLIRYSIGDIAVPAKNIQCSCGRGLPLLIKSVRGRDVNLFKTRAGNLIDGEYFTHLFYMKRWIKNFQVIQKDFNRIVINVVLTTEKKNKEILEINQNINLIMGERCVINWRFIDDIRPTQSGKYVYTISEI